MQQSTVSLGQMLLIGIQVRTNNRQEQQWDQGRIFPCVQKYFHQQLAAHIPNRKNPGTTICAYTDYESDYNGDYIYFIGEEVSDFDILPEGFFSLVVPKQSYSKFTTNPGAMPDVLANAWQKIWQMTDENLGGRRRYHTDFEVYDQRAANHSNLVLDIYIGLND